MAVLMDISHNTVVLGLKACILVIWCTYDSFGLFGTLRAHNSTCGNILSGHLGGNMVIGLFPNTPNSK